MISRLLKVFLGNKHQRHLKKLQPLVAEINAAEEQLQSLSDDQLIAKTDEFRERLRNGETEDDLLVEAYAVVKNACRRMCGTTIQVMGDEVVWDMIPYDVQLLGGIQLHQGGIAEMQTGEGKTLVAILPLYLNGLCGKGCHLVTTNDYLALRDSQWVGEALRFLGLTVGCIQHALTPPQRREQYAMDVTYGTNSEFGFDYLRDMGMARLPRQMVQRGYHYAIVDEIDNILIDEARTPLIISGPVPDATHQYDRLKPDVEKLVRKQTQLCTELVNEAKATLDKDSYTDEEYQDALYNLLQVRLGMPKHRQYMRLMENPTLRRALDKLETASHSDQNRGMLQEIKDMMYFTVEEKSHDASLGEKGREQLSPDDPESFIIPDLASQLAELEGNEDLSDAEKLEAREKLQRNFDEQTETLHNISQLLRAYCMYEKDVQYVVDDNKVIIVDEFTGRPMPGRRFGEGLHMALEAKESVTIEGETQTMATITIQNYFRMYDKLSGMTGTAETEATEFHDIYKLDVLVIPTNRPCVRDDFNDRIYKTKREKYRAIIGEIRECHEKGQPVLLGTISVEVSEILSRMLDRGGIPHNVLNAKQHAREAEIIKLAGQRGSVTIATNMAGRGTDIRLGEGVKDLGGLHVIGSERHDARRIDRQLRGRCARQGDPGSSRFYISLEDDLMRLFGSDKIAKLMERFGMEEGEELAHPWLNKSIETAQRKVEQHHYSIRKKTLQYDDVMNKQREVVYGRRREILTTEDTRKLLFEYLDTAVFERVQMYQRDEKSFGSPVDQEALMRWLQQTFPIGIKEDDLEVEGGFTPEALTTKLVTKIEDAYQIGENIIDPEMMRARERQVMLAAHDRPWQEHLYSMDNLRQEILLQSYGQRDPLVEYKKVAFEMFGELIEQINDEIAKYIFVSRESLEAMARMQASIPQQEVHQRMGQFDSASEAGAAAGARARQRVGATAGGGGSSDNSGEEDTVQPFQREQPKVGRNDPCPCGSGKKYKKCHGR